MSKKDADDPITASSISTRTTPTQNGLPCVDTFHPPLTPSRPAPPSPAASRRASGLSRASSRSASGMNTRPPSGIHHSRSVSATTPTSLRHSSNPVPPEPSPTSTSVPIHIRDYGFAPSDPRFSGQGPHVPRPNRPSILVRRLAFSKSSTTSEGDDDDGWEDDDDTDDGERAKTNVDVVRSMWQDMVDDGTNGWGKFKWGFGRAWGFGRLSTSTECTTTPASGGFPSRGDLDRNFGCEDEYEEMETDEEGEVVSDEGEVEPPLFPGLYRALYAFEPEGTAEMKLDEDQLVRVIGRGGGVGWAVVVKDGLKDTGVHALVPESYLEPMRLDGEDDDL